jgi:hypothetical protein
MRRPLRERFDEKWVPEPNSGCWLWLGAISGNGYGNLGGRQAHIVAYELYRGLVPDGLELDHTCRTRCCVNPWHLDPVTGKVNVLRAHHGDLDALPAKHASRLAASRSDTQGRTHCANGHEFTPENTYWRKGRNGGKGGRVCRRCRTDRMQRYKTEGRLAWVDGKHVG